jgi:hypothetical protein
MKVQCSVLFEDEKSKSVFMSNVRKLGTADEKFKSISIVHDMTKRERELSKEKVKHATEKNEENESGDYQYVGDNRNLMEAGGLAP